MDSNSLARSSARDSLIALKLNVSPDRANKLISTMSPAAAKLLEKQLADYGKSTGSSSEKDKKSSKPVRGRARVPEQKTKPKSSSSSSSVRKRPPEIQVVTMIPESISVPRSPVSKTRRKESNAGDLNTPLHTSTKHLTFEAKKEDEEKKILLLTKLLDVENPSVAERKKNYRIHFASGSV